MNVKRMKALAMAFLMMATLVMMCACGGDPTVPTGTTAGTEGSGSQEATYTVTVQDVLGNPYTENIVVLFKQNGQQVAMQPINGEGKAVKKMAAGQYDVELMITEDAERYYYSMENLTLSAAQTELSIVLSHVVGEDYEVLSVNDAYRNLYKLVFTPSSEGASEGTFTLEDPSGALSGTYQYAANSEGGFTVTNEAGEDVGMAITLNLDGSYAFLCPGMSYGQQMVSEGEATELPSGTYNVVSNEYNAFYLSSGCTYAALKSGERNFFVFTPNQSGIYEFTVHNAAAVIGYYGSPYFVQSQSAGEESGEQSMTVEIKDSMIGSGETGTTQLVIGIDSEDADCIISIKRVGDYVPSPEEMPWTEYASTYKPTKYTLPEGVTIQEFDLTAEGYTLVFNEVDGYYHLNSADGPVVLVRMNTALTYGGCFGDMLAHINVGVYFYEEDGTFVRKELYNECLLQYLGTLNKGMGTYSYTGGMLDDTYNVYPMTKDLEHIIKTYGEYAGWWDINDGDYLFAELVNVNTEIAWLFMCCYAE